MEDSFDSQRRLRVLLLHEDSVRARIIERALAASGHAVLRRAEPLTGLQAEASQPSTADVIIVDTAVPDATLLGSIGAVNARSPRPIILFTRESNRALIRDSVRAGVTSYIVDGLAPGRVAPIVDVAVARFEAYQSARQERDEAYARLAERKLIERAKGIVMVKRGLAEADAYAWLRKLAMQKGLKMSKLAEQVIGMAELLD